MSERYTKVFALPENLYAEGSPVVVSAGHLLRDNQTGKVLAQLKIKNISSKAIRAATVLIHGQDTAGKAIDGDAQQKYLDLTAKTGEEFGQKTAVPLPDASTRAFSLEVTQVVFEDSSTWEGTQAPWEPLPEAVSLSKELGDAELVKQYKLKAGPKCAVYPRAHKDLWLCACGTWNRDGKCCACGQEKDVLLNLDLAALTAERDARLAQEKAEREAREAADKAAAEARAKKTKKVLAIAIPSVIVLMVAWLLITKIVVPNNDYEQAIELMEAGEYQEALMKLDEIDGTTSMEEKIVATKRECLYREAVYLMDQEEYAASISIFTELEGYKDSLDLLNESRNRMKYREAMELLQNGLFERAYKCFSEISEYGDSSEYLSRFSYRLTQKKAESAYGSYTLTEYVYDSSGKLIEEKITKKDFSMMDHAGHLVDLDDNGTTGKKYYYDANGNIKETREHLWCSSTYSGTTYSLSKVEYEDCVCRYENNLPLHVDRKVAADASRKWSADYDYTYNSSGAVYLEEKTTYYTQSTVHEITEYNDSGLKIRYESRTTPLDDTKKEYTNTCIYEYDERGTNIKTTWTYEDTQSIQSYNVEYVLDENGEVVEVKRYYAYGEAKGHLESITRYENGRIVEKQWYNSKDDRTPTETTTYVYELLYSN